MKINYFLYFLLFFNYHFFSAQQVNSQSFEKEITQWQNKASAAISHRDTIILTQQLQPLKASKFMKDHVVTMH